MILTKLHKDSVYVVYQITLKTDRMQEKPLTCVSSMSHLLVLFIFQCI